MSQRHLKSEMANKIIWASKALKVAVCSLSRCQMFVFPSLRHRHLDRSRWRIPCPDTLLCCLRAASAWSHTSVWSVVLHAHRGVWTARLFLSDVVTVLLLLVSRIFTSKGLFWLKCAREGNGDSPFFVFHSHLSSRKTLGNCLTGTKRMEKMNQ